MKKLEGIKDNISNIPLGVKIYPLRWKCFSCGLFELKERLKLIWIYDVIQTHSKTSSHSNAQFLVDLKSEVHPL